MATTTSTTLSALYQTHFSKKLLDHAVQELRLNEFAMEAELPKNLGSKVIQWFRPDVGAASNVQTLTEGTPISTFRDVTYSAVSATLAQYGEAAKITDIVNMTGLFDALSQSIDTMGEDCALFADELTRAQLIHASTGLTKMYAQGLADFAATIAATVAASKLTGADLLRAATQLLINRAPKIDGNYVAIIPPQCSYDIKRDGDFLETAKYSNAKALYKNEIGTLWGVRCVEATNPHMEDETEGTYDSDLSGGSGNTLGLVYSTIVTGKGAYGVPKLAGTQSPWKPSIIINDKPDKSDPLNQFVTAGWKSFWTAKVLNANYGICLRGRSGFVG